MTQPRHKVTWKKWIDEMSSIRDFSEKYRDSMAEALSFAAPDGPRGFACVDDCRCDDQGRLFSPGELAPRADLRRDVEDFATFVADGVPKRIGEMIRSLGSQAAVARALQVSHGHLSRLLSGDRDPSDEVLRRMGLKRRVTYGRRAR